jgi:predicted phage-related endonuclease
LAEEILEKEGELTEINNDVFAEFTYKVYHEKIRNRDDLKKGVKLYENLKSDIERTCKHINKESIFSQDVFTNEKIRYKLVDELTEELEKLKL